MTTPAITWPAVFDGIGALVVNCALDPDALAAKIPSLTWIAPKVGGTDVAAESETRHCVARWTDLGLRVASWVYCTGPPRDDVRIGYPAWYVPAAVIYDVEAEYKSDEGGHFEWAAELVERHDEFYMGKVPAAVTSYGGYKTSIDFAAFARAGWPILAQCYDAYNPADHSEWSYMQPGSALRAAGPYPPEGVHRLLRSLILKPGEAVYRPEGIDG